MDQVIQIPPNLNPASLLPFSLALRATPKSEAYVLDFTQLRLAEPFGMLFLAAVLRQFVRDRRASQGKDCPITVKNFEDKTYASFMGLFKSFGLDHGNEPGEAAGSGTYIPLTRLAVARLTKDAREAFARIQEIVEKEAEKIAAVLTRHDNGPVSEALKYSICELMRNVIEHGEASHVWYAAQYWPTKKRVEVSVLDEGVGLVASLRRNRKLIVNDDAHAIDLALSPGISGIERPDRRGDGEWANTGFGLYMTRSICSRAGEFLLCNYSHAVEISPAGTMLHDCAFDGVAVRMVLRTDKIDDLNTMLREFRAAAAKNAAAA